MTEEEKQEQFIASAKAILDHSVEELDGPTLTRLRQARQRALEASPRRVPRFVWAGGFATATVALMVAALWFSEPGGLAPVPPLEDVEILASSEDLDFYDELDFYHWLADADVAS